MALLLKKATLVFYDQQWVSVYKKFEKYVELQEIVDQTKTKLNKIAS